MTKVKFLFENELPVGFNIVGHSTSSQNDEQGRLVCSAVSSAAYLVANTITDVIGATADIKVNDGKMQLIVKSDFEECLNILSGFKLHIEQLSEQFKNHVTIITEV